MVLCSTIPAPSYALLCSVVTLCDPHGLSPTRLLCPWDSPGKNTWVGCHAILQGNFLTQGSNLHLLWFLHCRWIPYCWAIRQVHVSSRGILSQCICTLNHHFLQFKYLKILFANYISIKMEKNEKIIFSDLQWFLKSLLPNVNFGILLEKQWQ